MPEVSLYKQLNQDKGDFYVMSDECIVCGAPQAEAPDLIDHSKLVHDVCYFKKQPETPEEIRRAIDAISVSCINALRYRGTNEAILKQLYEVDLAKQCDNKPIGNYKVIVRNRVTFKYNGTINELFDSVTKGIARSEPDNISNFKSNNKDYFKFKYRWYEGVAGMIYTCNFYGDLCEMEFKRERWKAIHPMNGGFLHDILTKDNKASDITWFDKDKSNKLGTPLPY